MQVTFFNLKLCHQSATNNMPNTSQVQLNFNGYKLFWEWLFVVFLWQYFIRRTGLLLFSNDVSQVVKFIQITTRFLSNAPNYQTERNRLCHQSNEIYDNKFYETSTDHTT